MAVRDDYEYWLVSLVGIANEFGIGLMNLYGDWMSEVEYSGLYWNNWDQLVCFEKLIIFIILSEYMKAFLPYVYILQAHM